MGYQKQITKKEQICNTSVYPDSRSGDDLERRGLNHHEEEQDESSRWTPGRVKNTEASEWSVHRYKEKLIFTSRSRISQTTTTPTSSGSQTPFFTPS